MHLVVLTGDRRRPLGEAMTNGLRKFRIICRRRRWYNCAGVEGLATIRFTSCAGLAAPSSEACRNLSILHEECSGPAPSKPCGSIMTRPLCLSHFAVLSGMCHRLLLTLGSSDERVDHNLRAVEEVTELRLPDRQQTGVRPRHADLEPKNGKFAQGACKLGKS